jgi:hypothetical protein
MLVDVPAVERGLDAASHALERVDELLAHDQICSRDEPVSDE